MADLNRGASPILLLEWWKPVVGYEDAHEVSNVGNVCDKNKRHKNKAISARGYYVTCVSDYKKTTTKSIHRLMGEAFIGPLPPKWHTNHKDGYKLGNRLSNLEYITQSENALHAWRLGDGGLKKLTRSDVLEIRHLAQHMSKAVIAKQFGTSSVNIEDIVARRKWKNVD